MAEGFIALAESGRRGNTMLARSKLRIHLICFMSYSTPKIALARRERAGKGRLGKTLVFEGYELPRRSESAHKQLPVERCGFSR
jgi:hypothetical protein